MTSTIEQPPTAPSENDEQLRHHRRTPRFTLLVVVVIAVALGGILIYYTATDDGTATAVPDEVLQVVDDFVAAAETADYEAFRAVTTDDFTRPEYSLLDDNQGRPETLRYASTHEYFERRMAAGTPRSTGHAPDRYVITRVGDPLIYGDGPWFVSTAEEWETRTLDDDVVGGIGFKAVATYAVVDDDGTFKVADSYWAGNGLIPLED